MGIYAGYFKLGMLGEERADVEASSLEEARKKVETIAKRVGGDEITHIGEITGPDPIALIY